MFKKKCERVIKKPNITNPIKIFSKKLFLNLWVITLPKPARDIDKKHRNIKKNIVSKKII
jgi:hypothetical protein